MEKKDQVLNRVLESIKNMTSEEYNALYESITEKEKIRVVTEDFDISITFSAANLISYTSGYMYSHSTRLLQDTLAYSLCQESIAA